MKNILLIGGSYGIGSSLAQILAENNQVIIASRSKPENDLNNVKHITFDASNDEIDLNQLPETIDGFVYFPGSINLRPFKGLSIDSFKQDLEINVISLIKVLKSILPKLNTSATAKGAIEGLAKSLAAEYAPKMRVNVIAPSIVDTPLANRFLNNETKVQKSAEKHPLNRVGNKEDIAEMISFLLSDKSSWMTGQILNVDGGLSTIIKN
jgi:NAD(P)-dependent dehydrogenase (short-subunit alcohol dehydrogenase family)